MDWKHGSRMKIIRQRILLIEDDEIFAGECSWFLRRFGYEVRLTDTLVRLDELITFEIFDIILLGQFVGGHNAVTLIGRIRRIFDGPIIMISNNTGILDQIIALESGADDFVLKLQPLREILARIRAVMRRISRAMDSGQSACPKADVERPPDKAAWQLSHIRRTLTAPNGAEVKLSSDEFNLLALFASKLGQPMSRSDISNALFRRPLRGRRDRAVDNLVSRLRRSLRPNFDIGNPIRPVRKTGYVCAGFDIIQTDSPPLASDVTGTDLDARGMCGL